MNKQAFKKLLREKSLCGCQHNWRPCGTCFFAVSDKITNQDRQTVLLYRWDYKKEDLDNLPVDIPAQLKRIQDIFLHS